MFNFFSERMLSTTETSIKAENELPLNLKTHVSF